MTQKYTQGANQRLPRCSASAGCIISTCPEGESKLCALGRQLNTSFSAEWTTGTDVRTGSEVFRRTGGANESDDHCISHKWFATYHFFSFGIGKHGETSWEPFFSLSIKGKCSRPRKYPHPQGPYPAMSTKLS
ncbi:hypothetical protein BDV24DRAFT_153104 [Aspergillus arachidicola]|uniref:Uncharacterized protein n=1 Tax=Aspergillus arachidicola TaxID=656916 RepID=A0A5N6Y5I9_9EURO|nr:hypothetical protein BDV24DRAFT_153104 [Aspergillus arachidicola]